MIVNFILKGIKAKNQIIINNRELFIFISDFGC